MNLNGKREKIGVLVMGGAMKFLHRKKILVSMLFYTLSYMPLVAADSVADQWTWLLYRTFSQQESDEYKQKDDIYFAKEDIAPFNQLVFSWNAFRPKKGYFSFWVQARQASTKKWGVWHHMMDWGSNVQRSYKSVTGFSRYEYVRLELDENSPADAFRIRIAVNDGANLGFLKAFSVALSNFALFQSETAEQYEGVLPSVHIEDVPTISQFMLEHSKNDSLCSPTSCTMLTSFFLQKNLDPIDFAEKSFDSGLGVYGSWPFNMAHAFEVCQGGLNFFAARLNSFARLHQRLQQGIPVAVSVRGALPTAASGYRYGHLLVVVGYDAKKQEVIVNDPAFRETKLVQHRYPLKGFLEAWERSRRLAYLAEQIG